MELNVEYLISTFLKYTNPKKDEMLEQETSSDSGSGGGGGGGGSYPKVPKWEELYQIKVGKANPRNKKGTKWETGIARGVGNQIW